MSLPWVVVIAEKSGSFERVRRRSDVRAEVWWLGLGRCAGPHEAALHLATRSVAAYNAGPLIRVGLSNTRCCDWQHRASGSAIPLEPSDPLDPRRETLRFCREPGDLGLVIGFGDVSLPDSLGRLPAIAA